MRKNRRTDEKLSLRLGTLVPTQGFTQSLTRSLTSGVTSTSGFDPLSLNPAFWFDMDVSMLAAGDAAAEEADLVATLENKVSGGGDATQTTASKQAVAKIPTDGSQPYLLMDLVDDEYEFTTDSSAVNGTIVVATLEGTYSANISLDASTQYDLQARGVASSANKGFLKNPVGYLISSSPLSASEITSMEQYFVDKGAAARSAFESVTNFNSAWLDCSTLTSFPLIDTSSGAGSQAFRNTWQNCRSLTSFPLVNTSLGTNFSNTWQNCESLTSLPLVNTSLGTVFYYTWSNCSSLTSFPSISTSSGTNFSATWYGCSSLTSFPLIDTSSGTNFSNTWRNCTSLTSFPAIDTSSATSLSTAWRNCSSLTSFPTIDPSSVRLMNRAWQECANLTTFPANFFDSWSPSSVTNSVFHETWGDCTSLTAQSVENILASLDTSGVYGTNTGASGGTQLSDNTIDIDYDGTTLSSATTTAITSLKSKNWAININNVIQ